MDGIEPMPRECLASEAKWIVRLYYPGGKRIASRYYYLEEADAGRAEDWLEHYYPGQVVTCAAYTPRRPKKKESE